MNILIITTGYPPINVSGSIRALYYSNYLAELGNEVHVLTTNIPDDFSNYDSTLVEKISSKVKVHRADMGVIFNKLYSKKSEIITNKNSKKSGVQVLKAHIKEWIAIPDSYLGWRKNAIELGENLIKEHNIDIVLSMHESPSSHLVAAKLKNIHPNVRMIGYWSDPWSFDPNRDTYNKIRKKIEFDMEKKVISSFDKYLFTTEETKNLYIDKFKIESDKTDIVYRGYDKGLFDKTNEIPIEIDKNKINITHAGEIFTNLRDINPFIDALYNIKFNNKELYEKLNIILLGGVDDFSKIRSIEELKCIKIIPRKPFKEAINYINNSDALLIWGNKNSCQLPGKAYDYLGAKSPIIAILGDETDPLGEFMTQVNKGIIINNNEKNIISELTNIESVINNENWTLPNDRFEWRNVVSDLLEKLRG